MLCDSGSTDETDWWMSTHRFKEDLAKIGLPTIRRLPDIPSKEAHFKGWDLMRKSWEHALAKIAWECTKEPPDALLWMCPDVLMPPGALKRQVAELEADPKLGAVSVEYEPAANHERIACTLYRWEAYEQMAEIGFFSEGCPCRWMQKTMERNGWRVSHLEGVKSTHLAEGGGHSTSRG
jgi:hypothetical protein